MLCANQAMIRSGFAFFADEPPVLVDWPPWNHTFGGNHDFGLVLDNGGSLYIDEGKPLPGAIEATVRNLRDIAPTIYLNVPKGFEMLLPYLRSDAALRETFFSRLKVMFYAGASLAQHVRDELERLAVEDDRRAHHLSVEPRLDRDRAACARLYLGMRACRQYRLAGAGRGTETGAERRQARSAAERAEHHAGLLARSGA